MRRRLPVVLVSAISLFFATYALSAQTGSIVIVEFGIYSSDRSAPELLEMTDEIPANVGTVFGVSVLATGESIGEYDFRWTFPEMQNPATSQVWTEMTGTRDLGADEPQAFLVRINHDWEAVAGDWTILISKADREIARKSFQVVAVESNAASNDCPTLAYHFELARQSVPERNRTLNPYSITHTVTNYYDAPLGLGFLEVIEAESQHYYDWMFELEMPVWREPDPTRALGWLSQGQVHSGTGIDLLTGAGMVETQYEHTNFIVWETQADWFKVRLTGDLYAWTHRCHLQTPKLKLEFVPWQKFFRRHPDWLHFRRPVPHILRSTPSVESDRVATIGLDHKLILLDVRDDWMEVEVEQPDNTCSGHGRDESSSSRNRGWVKWRDEQGPWVYIYTRGC